MHNNEPRILFWDREGLAWAGGFFSGEGCIYSRKGKGPYASCGVMRPYLCISQCTLPVLVKLQRIIKVGNITGPYQPKTKNSRPYWSWSVGRFEHVIAAVGALWLFLSEEKQDQCARILGECYDSYK